MKWSSDAKNRRCPNPVEAFTQLTAMSSRIHAFDSPGVKELHVLLNWHSAQKSTSYGEKVARTKIPTTPQKSGNE
jgi:hypothetical protein